jgi:uncharacterized membrane protein YbhN (UPF0104 family)
MTEIKPGSAPELAPELAPPKPNFWHWLSPLLGLGLFAGCLWVISQELRHYSVQQLLAELRNIPWPMTLGAIALMVLNYAVLISYDWLATRYVRQPLDYRQVSQVAIIACALSNMVGFALLSGSAVRYRFYKRWGFSSQQIGQVIAFCNLSFWLGLCGVAGILLMIQPLPLPPMLHLPWRSAQPLGVICLGVTLGYLGWSARSSRRMLILGPLHIPPISFGMALLQITIAMVDWMLAAAILYVLLLPHLSSAASSAATLSYPHFLAVYLLGQLAGVISHIPGGLGVFETVLLWFLTPPLTPTALVGALILYRGIYYFLPLAIAFGLWAIDEGRSRQR